MVGSGPVRLGNDPVGRWGWVGSGRVGQKWSDQVRPNGGPADSGRVGSGQVGLGQVGLGRGGSHAVGSGRVRSN